MDAWFVTALVIGAIAAAILLFRSRVKKIGAFEEQKPEEPKLSGNSVYNNEHRDNILQYRAQLEAWKQREAKHDKRHDEAQAVRDVLGGIVVLVAGIAVLLFAMSIFVVVGTNKVGIMTEAGKPTNAYSNGAHFKKPWAIKTEFDGTRQFLRFDAKGNDADTLEKKVFPCIKVKLDGQSTACLSGTVAWQMKADTKAEKENAVQLFKTYRTFERLTNNFVYSTSRVAFGTVFANHNPLVDEKNQSLSQLNELSLAALKKEFSIDLNVMSVDLAVPDYDDTTDKSIADVQAQKAKTRLANEEEETNIAKAKANAALEKSVQDPRVNQANCIQAAKEMGKEPGYCMMGGSNVIVDTGGSNKN